MGRKSAVYLIALMGILCSSIAWGYNVKFVEKMELSSEKGDPVQVPRSFCVTNDGLFIITDYWEGNLKLYEKDGAVLRWIKNIGQKGLDENNFQKPAICFLDERGKTLGVLDYGNRKLFLYERSNRLEFMPKGQAYIKKLGSDLKFGNNTIYIAGSKISDQNKYFELYSFPFYNDKKINDSESAIRYLLPASEKFGLNRWELFNEDYVERAELSTIGINGFFDIHGKYLYVAWEGNLRIIKQNIDTKEITAFGQTPKQYVKPYASVDTSQGQRLLDPKLIKIGKARMSYVRNIFTTKDYVMVVIEGPNTIKGENIIPQLCMQFYTPNGRLINEQLISGQSGLRMYFNKDKEELYFLINKDNNSQERQYYILKYKVKR